MEITIDKKKIIKVCIVIVAIVIVFVAVRLIVPLFYGYKGPIIHSIQALNEYDEDQSTYEKYGLLKSQCDMAELLNDLENEDSDIYYDYIEALKVKFGNKYKIDYEIIGEEKLGEDELDEIKESLFLSKEKLEVYVKDMENYCIKNNLDEDDAKQVSELASAVVKDYQELKITSGYRMDLECRISGSLSYADFTMKEIVIIKINGQWLFVSYYESNGEKKYYFSNPLTPEMIYSKVKDIY